MPWPPLPGRYVVGDEKCNVAICTLYSLDLVEKLAKKLGKENFAIIGKCVTENIGIERIVKNVIANPNIRYLVICGEEPRGHWVGQALKCLKEQGVDSEKRIIGAKGAMPYLRNLTEDEIEKFRKQIEIIDLIGEENEEKIASVVLKLVSRGKAEIKIEREGEIETIIASHDDLREFQRDEKGWFIIDLDRQRGEIVVEHYVGYDENAKLARRIRGKNAHEICATIARLGLVSRHDHAAYLGRELQKAELALKLGLNYEQDKELSITPVKVVVAAVITKNRKLLMVKRKQGYWELPGGEIEGEESAIEALKREVKEETGAEVNVKRFLNFYLVPSKFGENKIAVVAYLANIADWPSVEINDEDIERVDWIDLREVGKLNVANNVPLIVEDLMKFLGLKQE